MEAAKDLNEPCISGIKVKNILLPSIDVIWQDTWEALVALAGAGINIWFADQLPSRRIGQRNFEWYDFREESVRGPKCVATDEFCALSVNEILCRLNAQDQALTLTADQPAMLLKARFIKDGKEMYFVVNNSETDTQVYWNFSGNRCVQIWDPSDGSIKNVQNGAAVALAAYRGIFFVTV